MSKGERPHTAPQPDNAECWITQYRVRPRNGAWGAWATDRDYRAAEPAVRRADAKREAEKGQQDKGQTGAEVAWRVLKVTQEVVY